jgi:uncharacterized protein (TIGR02600 family)
MEPRANELTSEPRMNHRIPTERHSAFSPPNSSAGYALVLVLSFLVLITGLILAFFSSVTTDSSATRSYSSQASVNQLAESSVQTVMAQITTATSGTNIAWASQPGMIRTYTNADNTGNILANVNAYYKLYSSDTMVVTHAAIPAYQLSNDLKASVGDAVTDWASQPAIFTDLNAPVLGVTGTSIYPIVDPTAVADGFNLNNDPANNPNVSGSASMPVKWLYVLKNGALTAPSGVDATGKIANWSNSTPAPSGTNPIVGRIAFWTDDESCKLNLNTASEPTPWASPMAVTIQDLNFGKYQPAQNEYQRFPGHPFTTALSPVLYPGLSGTQTLTASQLQSIYNLIPRVQWGGSQAATVAVSSGSYQPVTPDQDRLFASVDEALFAPSPRTANTTPASPTPFQTTLEKARFFLTTNSRAPEVNLFGQPRVSIWPVPYVVNPASPTATESARQTQYDRLARFCSTIGQDQTKPYCFQRINPFSPTDDYNTITRNQNIYSYLQSLTSQAIPGYGGNFLAKWVADRDQVLTEIFDYIRCTNLRDPLLVQYTSGTANTADQQPYVYAPTGQVAPIQIGATQGFGRFYSISQFGFQFISAANMSSSGTLSGRNDTAVTNLHLTPGQSAVQASFFFEPYSPSVGFYQLSETVNFNITFKNPMTLAGSPFTFPNKLIGSSPQIGTPWDSGFTRQIALCDSRCWGGSAGLRGPIKEFGEGLGYPESGLVVVGGTGVSTMHFSGGTVQVQVLCGTGVTTQSTPPANLIQTFNITFPAADFPIPALVGAGTTAYTASEGSSGTTPPQNWWTLSENWTDPTSGTKYNGRYQSTIALPQMPGAEYSSSTRQWAADGSGNQPGFKTGSIFRAEDVVRTMVPIHGDLRLVAASANPSTLFVQGSNYNNTSVGFDHLLSEPEGTQLMYGFSNEPVEAGATLVNPLPSGVTPIRGTGLTDQLVPSGLVRYHYSRLPEITPGAGLKYNLWNDFDNGFGYMADGAYINKPDEGNISSNSATSYPYFGWDFNIDSAKANLFSPCRLVPSAGMFGSLPTGVMRNLPWQTLLFRPFVASSVLQQNGQQHPGWLTPRDHLIMDLFWMPVIEPYAISEPFSTAGKVNLNYQIAPFTYIRRATALYGAFKSEQPLVLPNSNNPLSSSSGNDFYTKVYKLWYDQTNCDLYPNDTKSQDPQVKSDWNALYNGQPPFDQLRRPIDMTQTLLQADDRFNGTGQYDARFVGNPDIFRSATEICELHLVRQNETLSQYLSPNFWDSALFTGDNARERPYANLYAKLTTKSNSYTVHFRVQVLKKSPSTAANQWDESRDSVFSEYRGSSLIERYIDPGDPRLSLPANDFTTNSNISLDPFYKFRVVSTKKFP